MAAMLKNKSRFLPTRSIPALVGFLVLMGCDLSEPALNTPSLLLIKEVFCGVKADESEPSNLYTYDFNYPGTPGVPRLEDLPLPAVPVDLNSLLPPVTFPSSAGRFVSGAVRAAASATSGSSPVVYILDKFANLLQFDPSSGTFGSTLNFSQQVTQGIAQRFAITPDRHFAFITVNSVQTGMTTGNVLVADLTSFSIVSTIPLPADTVAGGIAITPDGSNAYVVTQPYSGSGPSVVFVINVATRAITTSIPFTGYSNLGQIAITPDGTEAYLVNSIDADGFSFPVLDLQSNTVQPPVSIIFGSGKNLISSYSPSYIALHPDGTRLYLAPVSGGPVLIVSTITKTVTNVIPLAAGAGPVFGAQPTFTPDGIHLAFMSGMNLVVFVNTLTDTEESSIPLPPPQAEPIRNFSFFFLPKT
jgi:DNA-binding beta-propeller fold protein YncE